MKIADKLAQSGHSFSFEFFPPKDDKSAEALLRAVERLRSLEPAYVSVTWGAGGSTHRKTLDVVQMAKSRFGLESMAHLTCVGASKAEIDAVLADIDTRGIENVLALRGDPPQGDASFTPHPDGLAHADELVARIRARWGFSIGVAGYPEGHIESPSLEADLDHLKRKIDAGADFIVTQLFFDNDAFFRFVERVRAAGIEAPVLPGIMPITNVSQIKRFTDLCGASIPNACSTVSNPSPATGRQSSPRVSTTRPSSATSCWSRERRACTSTRSTSPAPLRRSSKTSAPRA